MKKFILIAAIATLTACSGNGVSKSELQKAIDAAGSKNAVCLPLKLNIEQRLPNENPVFSVIGSDTIKLLKRTPENKRANKAAIEQMEILVDANLYKQDKDEQIGDNDDAPRYQVYTLTNQGKQYFLPTPQGILSCIGKPEVKKINYFTEPTADNGLTVTHVVYEAELIPEKWAKKLLKESKELSFLNQTTTRTATLVKTNDGWRDIHELQ